MSGSLDKKSVKKVEEKSSILESEMFSLAKDYEEFRKRLEALPKRLDEED